MNPQHLSDEAVAAFADGVLTGHARERATRHVNSCRECHSAVNEQREAAWALRAAPAPALPGGLLDRLREVPQTAPMWTLPTSITAEGETVLRTGLAPMAALVPAPSTASSSKLRPIMTTAAVVALAGGLVAGSAVAHADQQRPSGGTVIRQLDAHPGSGLLAPAPGGAAGFRP